MKKYFSLFTKGHQTAFLLIIAAVSLLSGCKKEKDPTGRFMFYTLMNNSEFDEIKIFVDGKEAGKITLTHIERPQCGTPTSINVVNVEVPVGTHSWHARQYKNGVDIDGWDERDEEIKEGECNYIKLTE